jgi:hypothetical protein
MALAEIALERSPEGILTAKERWLESVTHPEKIKSQKQLEVREYVRSISALNERKAEIIALYEQAQKLYEESLSSQAAQASNRFAEAGFEQRFHRLADEWLRETGFLSDPIKKFMHRSHLRIIGMGSPALPFILREVEKMSGHWFVALDAISPENPVRPEDENDLHKVAKAWLEWGRREGII